MLLDRSLEMIPTKAIRTGSVSTNAVQLQVPPGVTTPYSPAIPDFKSVSNLTPMVQVKEDFVGCTALKATLQTCDTEDGVFEDVVGASKPLASLTQGGMFPFGKLADGLKSWVKFKFDVTGTATAGELVATLTDKPHSNGFHG